MKIFQRITRSRGFTRSRGSWFVLSHAIVATEHAIAWSPISRKFRALFRVWKDFELSHASAWFYASVPMVITRSRGVNHAIIWNLISSFYPFKSHAIVAICHAIACFRLNPYSPFKIYAIIVIINTQSRDRVTVSFLHRVKTQSTFHTRGWGFNQVFVEFQVVSVYTSLYHHIAQV